MSYTKPLSETMDGNTTPVIIDILGSDMETSLLPPDLKFLFHVNPKSMQITYQKVTARKHAKGGYVEFHWGDGAQEISFDHATGGFVRLYTGLSATTNQTGQGRRQTLAYESMMNYLSLFKFNGDIYDSKGNIAQKGYVKIIFEPGVYIGWFQGEMQLTQTSDSPFQFTFSSNFVVHQELMKFRSTNFSFNG